MIVAEEIEIVSGLAAGADSLGCLYAHERNLPVKHFPANWNKFGKAVYGHKFLVFADDKGINIH